MNEKPHKPRLMTALGCQAGYNIAHTKEPSPPPICLVEDLETENEQPIDNPVVESSILYPSTTIKITLVLVAILFLTLILMNF